MKVLHVTPYLHSSYGGPGVAIRLMAKALASLGGEAHVVTTNAAGLHDLPVMDGDVRIESGVHIKYFHRVFPRGWFHSHSMACWLTKHAGDYDVLHLHMPFTAPFRLAARAAQKAERPYIASSHGVLDPWCLAQKGWKKQPYIRYIEKANLARAKVLHVSSALEEGFVNAMKFGPKVWCLPLVVPLPAEAMGCPLMGRPRRVLSITRLHPVKALPVLFEALKRMRADGQNVLLDIAGEGDASFVSKLRKNVDDLGLREAVIWHGHVNEEKKHDLLAQASCLALLSYHENFGLAAAESLAAGVPVVVSDQVGLASDVQAYQAGLVVPVGNAIATAKALSNVIDSEYTLLYRERARKLAEECYGSSSFIKGLTNIYKYAIEAI